MVINVEDYNFQASGRQIVIFTFNSNCQHEQMDMIRNRAKQSRRYDISLDLPRTPLHSFVGHPITE